MRIARPRRGQRTNKGSGIWSFHHICRINNQQKNNLLHVKIKRQLFNPIITDSHRYETNFINKDMDVNLNSIQGTQHNTAMQ